MEAQAAESSTSGSETVTLRLPSGEEVDAIVPSGMSDEAVRGLMQQKHPEFFPASKPPVTMNQARPGFSGQKIPDNRYMIGGEPRQPMGEQLQDEAAGMLHSAARVSTPNIAQQLYKRYRGLPNRLEELPGQAATFLGTMMGDVGEPEVPSSPSPGIGRPAAAAEAVPQARALPHGQYEAPASPIPPQGQLGEGVIEGEYMEEPPSPAPTIRGALPHGQYEAPASALPPPKQLGPETPTQPSTWSRPEEPTPKFRIPAPSSSKISRPVTENPVVGSLVRAMQESGLPIAERPNLLLKGSGRVNRILGPEEELTGPLGKSLRQARRQREQ